MDISIVLILTIAAAAVALEAADAKFTLLGLLFAGAGICISFLLLGAPETSLLQLIVEVLFISIVLSNTTKQLTSESNNIGDYITMIFSAAIMIAILAFSFQALKVLPEFDSNSIVIGERNCDVMLAASVLLAAVLGAITIMRKVGKKTHE